MSLHRNAACLQGIQYPVRGSNGRLHDLVERPSVCLLGFVAAVERPTRQAPRKRKDVGGCDMQRNDTVATHMHIQVARGEELREIAVLRQCAGGHAERGGAFPCRRQGRPQRSDEVQPMAPVAPMHKTPELLLEAQLRDDTEE